MDPRLNAQSSESIAPSVTDEMAKPRVLPQQHRSSSRRLHMASIILRVLAVVAAGIAFYFTISATETQTITLGQLQITKDAKWQYASAFKFHLYANAIVATATLLTVLMAIVLAQANSKPRMLLWTLLLVDLVLSYVQMAAVAATMAVSLIGKYGNSHTNWMPICGVFPHFCDRVTWALIASGIALVVLAEITVLDVYNLTKYQIASSLGNNAGSQA